MLCGMNHNQESAAGNSFTLTLDEWVALSSEQRNEYRRRWIPTDDPMDQVNDWEPLLSEAVNRFRRQYGNHPLINRVGCAGSWYGTLGISVITAHFPPLVIEELPDRFMTFPVDQQPIGLSKQITLRIWTLVLNQLLGWSEERVRTWARERYEDALDDKDGGFFYHEDAYYYILPLLVPSRLRQDLNARDLSKLQHDKIKPAITHFGSYPLWLSPYDWDAARARINAILSEYGHRLPVDE
jgi:hypothetical protein